MEDASARASWALAAVVLVLALAALRLGPPQPRPLDAPRGEFSAARARVILAELSGDGSPHPTGSAAAAQVRGRILAAFRRLGLTAREEGGFVCRQDRVCAAVRNLVAELPGRDPASAVLLSAHYDSVQAGPGMADDLAGVATVLECARILRTRPRPLHSILFLLDEGEEEGLLGARAFAESSPEASRVRAMVNLEARGTSGPSLMFETGRTNAWLIPRLAGAAHPPRTSSLLPFLYEHLPNDTDFSVLARRGISGFNFAFIGNPAHVHTPLDNPANLSLRSLQHQGENALAATESLAGAELSRPHQGQAVFFDLLGFRLVWWPAVIGPTLGILAVLSTAVTALRSWRRGSTSLGSIALGLLALLASVLIAFLLGLALRHALRLASGWRAVWPAAGWPGVAAFWLVALASALAVAGRSRRAGFLGLWSGVWLGWSLLGFTTAILMPGISYLFLVPALAAGGAGLLLLGRDREPALAAMLPAVVAGALWFPTLMLLYNGLGTAVVGEICASVAAVCTTLLPVTAPAGRRWRRAIAGGASLAAVVLAGTAMLAPGYSRDSPRQLNIIFQQDAATGTARWLFDSAAELPASMRRVPGLGKPVKPLPWQPPELQAYIAAPEPTPLPGPTLVVEGDAIVDGKRQLRLRLRSARGAPTAFVFIPESAELEWATIAGRPVPLGDRRRGGFLSLGVLTLAPEGAELAVTLGSIERQVWFVEDRSAGLPSTGAALVRSRPAWAVPALEGDTTWVGHRVPV